MANIRLRPPGVNVYQIFETESLTIFNATLSPCLIGEAYQLRTDKSAGSYAGDVTFISYPEKLLTSMVDKASVRVKVEAVDGDHEIARSEILVQSTTGTTDGSVLNKFVDSTANYTTANIEANDVLVVIDNGTFTPYTVASVTNATTLVLSAGLALGLTGVDYFIFKGGKFVALDDKAIIAGGIIYAGAVLISYTAKRTDHTSDYITISRASDLQNNFVDEEIIPSNPLPYAVMIAMANGTPGLTIRALIVEDDNLTEHVKAQSFIGLRDNVWSIVPLTQRHDILQSYSLHVTTASQPLEKKERVLLMSHDLITKDTRLLRAGSVTAATSMTGATAAGTDQFNDVNVDFVATAVVPGDFVNILSGPLAGAYPIDGVTSATRLSLSLNIASSMSGVEYEIVQNFFDRSEIADNVQARSISYTNRRVVAMWPHEVDVTDPLDSNVILSVPTYFVCAAYAAIAASLPPQTPFSRMPVAGFIGLRYSNDYFTDEELDMMAAGGTWIMVQNGEGANLEVRHQLTTDTTTIERREWNITKDVDYIAKTWRQTLTPLTGRNLLTDNFLTTLKVFAQSLVNSAIAGGQLLSGSSLQSVERNPDASDTVDFRFRLNPPRPANTFNLYLVV